jgi:hypothetical protein
VIGDHFVHCRDCDALFRPSPLDRAPAFHVTADGTTVEEARDDCMAFLTEHARHALETLRLTGAPAVHDGSLSDPMASSYREVTNGTDVMVVHSGRASLDEPIRHRIVPGRVLVEPPAVEIPAAEVRTEIDRALYPGTAPDRKLDAFVGRFKAIAWDLDPATLEIVYDLSGDPTSSVAKLPAWALARLAHAAHEIFDATDAARIVSRLDASVDDPDAFTVVVRQRVRLV